MFDGYMSAPSEDSTALPQEESDRFDEIVDNPFIKTSEQNVFTFSIDADGAAYGYMRKMFSLGRIPEPSAVRIEEYLNYFTYKNNTKSKKFIKPVKIFQKIGSPAKFRV